MSKETADLCQLLISIFTAVGVPVATLAIKSIVDNAVKRVEERLNRFELAVTIAAGDRKAFEAASSLRYENLEGRIHFMEGLFTTRVTAHGD